MFRRFGSIALRNLYPFGKAVTLTFTMFAIKKYHHLYQPIQCFNIPFKPVNMAGEIISNVVRIQQNGQFVGYGYALDQKTLVTTSREFTENKKTNSRWEYQFFLGEEKINTRFKMIGKFQNLAFIQAKDDILTPMPSTPPEVISPVEILRKMAYLSIKQGYYVSDDCGFGIIDGKGQVGSLVINKKGVLGLVTQVGRDSDRGFLRMVHWKQLKNVLKRINEPPLYLGLSARALEERDGISLVRVAPDSPFVNKLQMGDIILKVNQYQVHHPQDLMRSIMFSKKTVILEVITNQNEKKIVHAQL